MEPIERFDIVRSLAGHDREKLFLVLELRQGRALIADGKTRKVQKPKLKSLKHLELEAKGTHRPDDLIGSREISNREISKLLAVYRRNAM